MPRPPRPPIATTAADWKPVTDTLGRTGKLSDNNTTYRMALPRNDLQVVTEGVPIKPGLSLGGYAAVRQVRQRGDADGRPGRHRGRVTNVTDALQAHGIAQTALHKHLLEQTPPVWWTHIHAWVTPSNSPKD